MTLCVCTVRCVYICASSHNIFSLALFSHLSVAREWCICWASHYALRTLNLTTYHGTITLSMNHHPWSARGSTKINHCPLRENPLTFYRALFLSLSLSRLLSFVLFSLSHSPLHSIASLKARLRCTWCTNRHRCHPRTADKKLDLCFTRSRGRAFTRIVTRLY